MKILLVDDESLARQRLRLLLEELKAGEVVAEAGNGQQALSMVQQHQADLVLLDIRMPGMDGIETAQHLSQLETPPAVIFTTAYDDYALRAFEANAVGYLLKPIRQDKLDAAIKVARRLTRAQLQQLNVGENESGGRTHISAKMGDELRLIPIDDIYYFQAEHKYVTVCYREGEVLIEEPLKMLEEEFNERFFRIHRNALVAVQHLALLEKDREGHSRVKFKEIDDSLEVSRRHLPGLRKLIKSF